MESQREGSFTARCPAMPASRTLGLDNLLPSTLNAVSLTRHFFSFRVTAIACFPTSGYLLFSGLFLGPGNRKVVATVLLRIATENY